MFYVIVFRQSPTGQRLHTSEVAVASRVVARARLLQHFFGHKARDFLCAPSRGP